MFKKIFCGRLIFREEPHGEGVHGRTDEKGLKAGGPECTGLFAFIEILKLSKCSRSNQFIAWEVLANMYKRKLDYRDIIT